MFPWRPSLAPVAAGRARAFSARQAEMPSAAPPCRRRRRWTTMGLNATVGGSEIRPRIPVFKASMELGPGRHGAASECSSLWLQVCF